MDIKDQVAGLRKQVEALSEMLGIVLMMLTHHAPELPPQPVEAEPQIIHDYKDINFPI
jgi:hypothetical protein